MSIDFAYEQFKSMDRRASMNTLLMLGYSLSLEENFIKSDSQESILCDVIIYDSEVERKLTHCTILDFSWIESENRWKIVLGLGYSYEDEIYDEDEENCYES